MDRSFLKKLVNGYKTVSIIVMMFMALVVLWFNVYAGIACVAAVIIIFGYFGKYVDNIAEADISDYEEDLFEKKMEERGLTESGKMSNSAASERIEELQRLYDESESVFAVVSIDNYEDLISSNATEQQSTISAEIDKTIRGWGKTLDASVTRVRNSRYIMLFDRKYLDGEVKNKFPILNKIHEIETDADFPISLSIGIGCGSRSFDRLQELADDAMGLALGRGGDQAVLKNDNGEINYYGGQLPTVEKRNKSKVRVISHALMRLIDECDNIFIMGHTRPDMDSIGAAIGVSAIARFMNKPADIILNDVSDSIDIIYEEAVKTGNYSFIDSQKAMSRITDKTLVIVVDLHIAALTECPGLLDKTKNVVVIDHHRRSPNAIENPTLNLMESYASSTCELISEILQYIVAKQDIDRFDAEALLAGIMVDTNGFAVNVGVRTFEAASWLKRMGADINKVRSFFKLRLEFFKKKLNIIANAEIIGGTIAVAYTKDTDPAMQVLLAQAANELLDMRGVDAAFTAGRGSELTLVSARSAGKINVQTIMEKLGGGGHLNVAGAQVSEGPEEAIARIVNLMRESGEI